MAEARNLAEYVARYNEDSGFERIMVEYRRRLVLERLTALAPRTGVEVGCGSELVAAHYPTAHSGFRKWVIVEPSAEFAKAAAAVNLPNVAVVENVIEAAKQQVLDELGEAPDAIVIASVLHEVIDPRSLLQAAVSIMGDRTSLHVNVPNADSLHRQLAVAMGMARNVAELSARNLTLLQNRVYTLASLREAIEEVGLRVCGTGGFFLKLLTHEQMQLLLNALEKGGAQVQSILDGLDKLGRDRPEMASEIFIEATKAK